MAQTHEIDEYLMHIRNSTMSVVEALKVLVDESNNTNLQTYLSQSHILDIVVDREILGDNSSAITSATTFLLNLSKKGSLRVGMASSKKVLSFLSRVLLNRFNDIPVNTFDDATMVLYNLSLHPEARIHLAILGNMFWVLGKCWVNDYSGTEEGRQFAGMAVREILKNIVTIQGLVEEHEVVEGIIKLATNREKGNTPVRGLAFEVLAKMRKADSGMQELLKINTMDKMVMMLEESESEIVSCYLHLLWKMFKRLPIIQFRELAEKAGLKDVLVEISSGSLEDAYLKKAIYMLKNLL